MIADDTPAGPEEDDPPAPPGPQCPECEGTGAVPGSAAPCPGCGGKGQVPVTIAGLNSLGVAAEMRGVTFSLMPPA